MKHLYWVGLLCLCISAQAQSTIFVFKNGAEDFKKELLAKAKPNIPGYALAVIHKDSMIFSATSGIGDMSTNEQIDLNTPFYIASIGKTMTAAAILLLRQEKKIQLQDNIEKYLSGLPTFTKDIQIYHLLTHTSGLPDYYDTYGEDLQGFANQNILDFVKACDSLQFYPGVDYAYSNTAYVLLAMIIEKVSGLSFAEFLKQQFFTPLGMNNTIVIDKPGISIPHKVIGYVIDSTNNLKTSDYQGIYATGAGGIYSTVGDLQKWMRGLRSGKIVSERSWSLMLDFPTTTAGYISYIGMGWTNESYGPKTPEWYGLRVFGSIGLLKGFCTKILYFPDLNLEFILLCNSGKMEIFSDEFIRHFVTKIDCVATQNK